MKQIKLPVALCLLMVRALRAAALCLTLGFARHTAAANLYWTNLSGGDWNTAANWSPHQVPTGTDNVFVISNGTYGIGISATILSSVSNLTFAAASGTQTLDIEGGLVLNGACVGNANAVVENVDTTYADTAGGYLNGNGTMTLAGPLYWEVSQEGILTGQVNQNITLSKITTTTAVLCNPFVFSGPVGFSGTEWVNNGNMTICFGPLNLASNSVLSNAPGATISFTILGNNPNRVIPTNGIGGTGAFINNGKLLVLDTNGQDFVSPSFVNNGQIVISNGAALDLSGGGTNTGTITNSANCTLVFTNGICDMASGSFVDSQGPLFNGSTLHIEGTVKCPSYFDDGTTQISGLLQVTNSCTIYGTEILTNSGRLLAGSIIDSGTINEVSAGTTVSVTNTLTLNQNSTATFEGILNVGGNTVLNYNSGITLGGTAHFTNNLDIAGGGVIATNSANVSVGGTLTLSSGGLSANGSGTFTAATFDFSSGTESGSQPLQVNGPFTWSGGTLNGIVECAGGNVTAANSTMNGEIVNSGAMGWAANPITLQNGAEISNTGAGTMNITNSQWNSGTGGGVLANSGVMNFYGSDTVYTGFLNGGTIRINTNYLAVCGGTNTGTMAVATNATLSVGNSGTTFYSTASGSITGPGTLSVNYGTLNSAGALSSPGGANGVILSVNGGTANFTGAATATPSEILFANGTMNGSQLLSANGPFFWSSGTLSASIQCVGGAVTVQGGNSYAGQIVNTGTMGWNSGIYCYSGTFVSNAPGGVVNITNASFYSEGGSSGIANAGQMNILSSCYTSLPMTNTGAISISGAATLNWANGGIHAGSLAIASGGKFQPSGGTVDCLSGSVLSGLGTLDVTGATINLDGSLNVQGTWLFESGAANYNGASAASGYSLDVSGGTVTLQGTGSLAPGVVNLSGGQLGGTQTISDIGAFNWSGGTFAGIIQCNGGLVNVNGGSCYSGQIINTGAMSWNAGIYCYAGTLFSNTPAGVFNFTNTGLYSEGNGSGLANAGQMNVLSSTYISIPITNTSTLNITNGTFNWNGGGTHSGAMSIAAGATFEPSGGTLECASGSVISGPGSLDVTSGTVNFDGALDVQGTWLFQGGAVNYNGTSTSSGYTLNAAGSTLTLQGAGTLAPAVVNLSGGQLGGAQVIADSGAFNWSGGTLAGTIQCNGGLMSAGGASSYGGQIINSGTMLWNSSIYCYSGTLINNLPGGIFNFTNTSFYAEGTVGVIVNSGQMNVQSSCYTSVLLTNIGGINISGGTFNLGGGGAHFGSMSIASGAALDCTGYTLDCVSNSVISGAGILEVAGATVNFNGALNVQGQWQFQSGTVNYNGTTSTSGNTVTISGGSVNLNGSGTLTPGVLNLSGGSLAGGQAVSVAGPFNWSGGTLYGAVQCVGGLVNVNGASSYGQIINTGVMAWNPSPIYAYSGTLISNAPSGVFNVTNATVYPEGSCTFANAGQVNVWSTSTLYPTLNNVGTINVNAGTLSLNGGTNAATIAVATNATLALNSTFEFLPASVVSGTGGISVNQGTIDFDGALNLRGPWQFLGGTVNYNGTTTSTGHTIDISAGAVNFNAATTLSPGTVNFSGGGLAGSETLNINGPFNWTGGNLYGVVQCAGGVISGGGANSYGGHLINTGAMTWNASPFYIYSGAWFSNAPTGVLNLSNCTIYAEGPAAIGNGGRLNVLSSSYVGIPLTNSGTVYLNTGTLTLAGGEDFSRGTLNFGIASLSSFGTLNISGNAPLAGSLALTLNGYTPLIGDTFNLISYGSESGAFGTFTTPSSANWQETYGATEFSVQVSNFAQPTNVTLFAAQGALGADGFSLEVSGPTGSNYMILVSTNLAGTNWTALTNFMSTTSLTTITDSGATNYFNGRFYRAFIH